VRQRNHARAEAEEHGDGDAALAEPRPRAEHSSQISDPSSDCQLCASVEQSSV
jgi:hypothetical protein